MTSRASSALERKDDSALGVGVQRTLARPGREPPGARHLLRVVPAAAAFAGQLDIPMSRHLEHTVRLQGLPAD